jgi:predicted  nucleic acid-binding Zn-ribbon protein
MQREFLSTIHDSERADMLANLRQRALQLQGFVRQDDPWSSALVMDRDKTLPYDSVAAIRSKQAHHLAQLESTYLQSRRNQIQAELSALTGEHVHLSKAVGSKDSNVRRLLSLRNELDAQYELELQRQAKEEEAFWVHRTSSAEEELSEVKKENEAVRLRLESMRARIAELRSATETQECEWWNVQEAISGDESKTADLRQREDVLQESISQASKAPTQTSKPVSPSLDSKNGEVSATDVKSGFDSHATAELFLEREDDVVDYPGAVAEFGATPLMGPVKGGTVVVVSGLLALHAFRTGEVSAIVSNSTRKVPVGATVVRKIRPQDASAPVQREKRQGGAVELRMPMWNSAGSVEITVLVQGQPLKHPAISFSYFSEPTISSITPSAGPSYQCTKVIIKGDNFYQSVASCAAGGEQVCPPRIWNLCSHLFAG